MTQTLFFSLFFVSVVDAALPTTQPVVPSKNVKVRPSVKPVDLHSGPQLFIDDYLIAESTNLQSITHPPTRFGDAPVLGNKALTMQPYVTVLRDPATGRFRMWYNSGIGQDACIAYAESPDGVHWETPSLGILGPDNRLLKITTEFQNGYGVSVIDDGPGYPDPAHRYKMAWWGQSKVEKDGVCGMRVAFSPNGLHWTLSPIDPALPDYNPGDPLRAYGVGDIIDVFYDPIRRRYGGLFKTPALPSDGLAPGPRASSYIRRLVSASYSKDFVKWERPWRVIVPEPSDEGLLEFYSSGGTITRGPLLISFARMLHDDWAAEKDGSADGVGYATLVTSRDGEHWERHKDIFFDRNPTPGTWDRAMTWIGSVLPVGNEFFIYYGGYKRGHKVEPKTERQIGLAKMPIDRFISRSATGEKPGRLLTVPLRLSPGTPLHLVLNVDASGGGKVSVNMLDEEGKAIPGFEAGEPITSDGLTEPVRWNQPLSSIGDRLLRLEFVLRKAALFGFSFKD